MKPPATEKGKKTDSPLDPPEGTRPADTLMLGHLASRTVLFKTPSLVIPYSSYRKLIQLTLHEALLQ